MSIEVPCECGKHYFVPESRAGKCFKCYRCNRELVVPTPHDLSSEGISSRPIGYSIASSPSEPAVPRSATLALVERMGKLGEKAEGRLGLGLCNMVAGAALSLWGFLEEVYGDQRIAIGLFFAGVLTFILGFRQFMRWL